VGSILTLFVSTIARPAWGLDPDKLISQFIHTAWTASDGVPGAVRAIAQTPDGYLWLGTPAGLYRFDGISFTAWHPNPGGARLVSDFVCALHVADDGALWIGYCSGGISVLRNGYLQNYRPGNALPGGAILSIVEDHEGRIWAAGQYGLIRRENNRWVRTGAEMSYPAPAAQSLLADSSGNLWVATDGFDFRLSPNRVLRNTVLRLAPGATRFSATGLAVGQVWSMREALDGSAWIADTTGKAIARLSGVASGPNRVSVGAESTCLLFDSNRSVWVGLITGGLRRIRNFGQPQNQPADRFQTSNGLSGGIVYSTFRDREGNVWFGTTGGLDRFRENKVLPFSAREGLDHDQQVGLAADKSGSLWLYSYAGEVVTRFDGTRFTSFRIPVDRAGRRHAILGIYAAPNNDIWLAGESELDRGTDGRFSPFKLPPGADGSAIEAIATDSAGNPWITLWNRDSADKIFRFRHGKWEDLSNASSLPNYRCRLLFSDSKNRMWLGFENGEVAVFDGSRFRQYSSRDGLSGQTVLAITSDRTGHVWVSSQGGLSRFEGSRFITLSSDNGLPGNSISGFAEDNTGAFWIAGALGILRVTAQELDRALASSSYRMQGQMIEASDGLRGLPLQRMVFTTVAQTADGKLWFSTSGGIAAIDPENLPKNKVPPPVQIETLVADNRGYSPSRALKLPPGTKTLEFHFTALSLTDPELVRFRFKLEGYDEDWRGPVKERIARYTNLPPGQYRFRVLACNNDGVWNESGAALPFSIAPTFTQTGWFTLLCALVVVGLAALIYRVRVHQVTRNVRQRMYERMAERERIARNLHDTFLQSIQGLLLRFHTATSKLDSSDPSRAVFEDALRQSDQVMLEGRRVVLDLRATATEGNDLPAELAEQGRRMQEERSCDFRLIVNGSARPLHPVIFDEVAGIGREALGNAFRHSDAQSIEAELNYEPNELRMCIRDNGVGIDPVVLRQGYRAGHWGLPGMRERAKKIRAELNVWSRNGAGTEIELRLSAHLAYSAGENGAGGRSRWRNRTGDSAPGEP
jgi:ligand-binding sensor domain-containing protein